MQGFCRDSAGIELKICGVDATDAGILSEILGFARNESERQSPDGSTIAPNGDAMGFLPTFQCRPPAATPSLQAASGQFFEESQGFFADSCETGQGILENIF